MLNETPATIVAAITQAMVEKNRASPRSVSLEYGIVAIVRPPSRWPQISSGRGGRQSAGGDVLPVEADVDGHFAEPGYLERNGEVLADRVLGRRTGEAHQD